jgi:hypothetical protein
MISRKKKKLMRARSASGPPIAHLLVYVTDRPIRGDKPDECEQVAFGYATYLCFLIIN